MEQYVFGLALGLAMAIVNVFKSSLPAAVVPLASFVLAVALGAFWAVVFGISWLTGVQDVAIGAAITLGLFASTDAGMNVVTYGKARPTKLIEKK